MGLDPRSSSAARSTAFGTNAVATAPGPHYVVEADESDGSFVYLTRSVAWSPTSRPITWTTTGRSKRSRPTFCEFMAAGRTRRDARRSAVTMTRLVELAGSHRSHDRHLRVRRDADVRCRTSSAPVSARASRWHCPDGFRAQSTHTAPGDHMVANATAALADRMGSGARRGEAPHEALAGSRACSRRFDLVGEVGGVTVVDDYAHHPTEVRATLTAARRARLRARDGPVSAAPLQPYVALAREFGEAFGARTGSC